MSEASTPSRETGAPRTTRLPRPFAWTLTASGLSGLGDGMVAAAFPLLVASETDNPMLIAGVLAAQRAPWVAFSLHGGALVDRLPLRRLLPAVDLARFVAVAALTVLIAAGGPVLVAAFAAAFVVGTGDTIMASGLHSAVPRLVAEPQLDRANGLIVISQSSTEHLAGPALGGILFAVAVGLPFGLDAATFLASALLLAKALPSQVPPAPVQRRSVTGDVMEGLRWFFAQADLRLLTVMVGSFAMLQGAVLGILVIFTNDALGGDSITYGLVLAGAAVGNLVGALLTERVAARFSVPTMLLAGGVTAGLGYVIVGLSPWAWMAAAGLALEGLAIGVANTAQVSYRQRRVPADMLGRGAAAIRLVGYGSIPVGALLAGWATSAIDVRAVISGFGLVQVAVALLVAPLLRAAVDTALGASVSR